VLYRQDLRTSEINMNTWTPNPNWKNLEMPSQGDIAQFKITDGFSFLIKLIVTSVDLDNDQITGTVDAVYDWDTKELVTGSPIKKLVGTQQTLDKTLLQNVVRNILP